MVILRRHLATDGGFFVGYAAQGFPLKVEAQFGLRYSAGVVCGGDAEAGCFLHVAAGFQLRDGGKVSTVPPRLQLLTRLL